ncbi:MAG: DUF4863 family protein [Planctomycetes bacterium]|nr:DUF4863 family protein [Planctomycetota bacterium]
MSQQALLESLGPILQRLATIDTSNAEAAMATLNQEFPIGSERIQLLRKLFAQGKAEGWLCDREAGSSRFSRVAKSAPEVQGFSIDAVELTGAGVWHKHTEGEIDLCFASKGDAPTFDGHSEGWVVFPPQSEHVPTVDGGTMDILYFLPNGAVEWKRG